MRIKLTIAAAAAAFALASVPTLAVEMPAYGSKNFTTPGVAPSYFTNESGAISARGPDTAAVPDETEDATAADVPLVNPGTGRHGKYASSGKHASGKHASGKSKGNGGSTHYTKASSAKSTAGRSGTQAGAGKTGTTKHAKSGIRQHAAVASPPARVSVA